MNPSRYFRKCICFVRSNIFQDKTKVKNQKHILVKRIGEAIDVTMRERTN